MQLQIEHIIKEIHLWSYEYKIASQMVISDVTQHPGLQQCSSYGIKIEKPLQSVNLSLHRVSGMALPPN